MYELLEQVSGRYIRAKIYMRKYLIFLQYFMYLLLVMTRNLPR